MQSKKLIGLVLATILVLTVYLGYNSKQVDAGCKCISQGTTDQAAGVWVAFDDGSGLPLPAGGAGASSGRRGAARFGLREIISYADAGRVLVLK